MEHEFVPGKRRCRICHNTAKFVRQFDEPCDPMRELLDPEPSPEPEPQPQWWHMNVWTSVNGVIFTGSHQYSGPDVIGWAQAEAVNKVAEIVVSYTPKEVTE
jgi:hypothetical protein